MHIESRREQARLQEELSMKGKGSPNYSEPKYSRNRRSDESSRTTSSRILSAKNKRKSRDNSTAHCPIAAKARSDEFCE